MQIRHKKHERSLRGVIKCPHEKSSTKRGDSRKTIMSNENANANTPPGANNELTKLLAQREVNVGDLKQHFPAREMPETERTLYALASYFMRAEESAEKANQNSCQGRRDFLRLVITSGIDFERKVRPILLELGMHESRISEMATIIRDADAMVAYFSGAGFQRTLDQARGIPSVQRRGMKLLEICQSINEPLELGTKNGWRLSIKPPSETAPLNESEDGGSPPGEGSGAGLQSNLPKKPARRVVC
jgi:hypothetical protein